MPTARCDFQLAFPLSRSKLTLKKCPLQQNQVTSSPRCFLLICHSFIHCWVWFWMCRCPLVLFMCECVCRCVYSSQWIFLLTPHSRFGAENSRSLADGAGRSPGDQRGETIPTKWHELMWLINTTLIICKLHVWVHITWETYAAFRVRPNKRQLICISGVPYDWRRANQHSAGKRKHMKEKTREK